MTLQCDECGSYALAITAQSYDGDHAFESCECEHCGASGSLSVTRTYRYRTRE